MRRGLRGGTYLCTYEPWPLAPSRTHLRRGDANEHITHTADSINRNSMRSVRIFGAREVYPWPLILHTQICIQYFLGSFRRFSEVCQPSAGEWCGRSSFFVLFFKLTSGSRRHGGRGQHARRGCGVEWVPRNQIWRLVDWFSPLGSYRSRRLSHACTCRGKRGGKGEEGDEGPQPSETLVNDQDRSVTTPLVPAVRCRNPTP